MRYSKHGTRHVLPLTDQQARQLLGILAGSIEETFYPVSTSDQCAAAVRLYRSVCELCQIDPDYTFVDGRVVMANDLSCIVKDPDPIGPAAISIHAQGGAHHGHDAR